MDQSNIIKIKTRDWVNLQLLSIENHICQQLQLGIIALPKQQTPFRIIQNKKIKTEIQQALQKESNLQKLQKQRLTTLARLQEIQRQEWTIKYQRQKTSNSEMNRSLHTQDDIKSIKRILKQKKIYQRKIKQKDYNLIKMQQQQIMEQKIKQQQGLRLIREKRKNALIQQMKKIQQQKQKRNKQQQQLKSKCKDKYKKYIFQIYRQKDKIKTIQQINRKQEILRQIRTKKKFDFKEILNHQLKYKQSKNHKQQNNNQDSQLQNSTNVEIRKTRKAYSENYFSRLVKQETQQKRQNEKKKQQRGVNRQLKIYQFQEYVRQKFKPKISLEKSQQSQSKNQKEKRSQALSQKQLNQLGNKYLKVAKKLRKSQQDLIIDFSIDKLNLTAQKNQIIKNFFGKDKYQVNQSKQEEKVSQQFQSHNKDNKIEKLYASVKNKIEILKMFI